MGSIPSSATIKKQAVSSAVVLATARIRIIGCSTPEFTLVDYPTVDDPVRNDLLKSSDRLKQEVDKEQV